MAVQVPGDPHRLQVYAPALAEPKAGEPVLDEPLPQGLTAVTIAPHGVAWADRSGRVCVSRTDLLGVPSGRSKSDAAKRSFWCGSVVRTLGWVSREALLTGDADGRLLRWDLSDNLRHPPTWLASSTTPWIEMFHGDDGGLMAVAADGRWVRVSLSGEPQATGVLPLTGPGAGIRQALAFKTIEGSDVLVYRAGLSASGDQAGGAGSGPEMPGVELLGGELPGAMLPGGIISGVLPGGLPGAVPGVERREGWLAWDVEVRQPVALPPVVRYADMLVADDQTLYAMNREGSSWRWRVGDPEPSKLRGWPAGTGLVPLRIGPEPTVMRLSDSGRVDVVTRRSDRWLPVDHPLVAGSLSRGPIE